MDMKIRYLKINTLARVMNLVQKTSHYRLAFNVCCDDGGYSSIIENNIAMVLDNNHNRATFDNIP